MTSFASFVIVKEVSSAAMAEKSLFRQYARATLRIVQGVIEVVMHWLFGFAYGGPGQSMPPIKDLILLDSATTIAFKIRTGKVSPCTFIAVLN